jgi:hypothetical protein
MTQDFGRVLHVGSRFAILRSVRPERGRRFFVEVGGLILWEDAEVLFSADVPPGRSEAPAFTGVRRAAGRVMGNAAWVRVLR